jgi:hypothetical protein
MRSSDTEVTERLVAYLEEFEMYFGAETPTLDSPYDSPSAGDNKTVVKTEHVVQEVTTDIMSTIKIGDVEFPMLGAKKRALSNTAEQVLYNTKDERKNLSTDERTVLFKSAMQPVSTQKV